MALQIIGNTLYVGGSFGKGAGLATADFLVACDLTTGVASGTVVLPKDNINSGINALTADSQGRLYVGGAFNSINGSAAFAHVGYYQAGKWHPLDAGVPGYVRSLGSRGTDVYVGTDAVNINGIAQADHLARWDGSAWHAVGSNAAGTNGWLPAVAFPYAITTEGSPVFGGGSFQNADGIPTADEIGYFDGTAWHPLGSDGAGNGPLNAQVSALAYFRLKLYAGGNFTNVGGDNLSDSIASYWLLRPDARIGSHQNGPFAGDGVYSATGAGETNTVSVARGSSIKRFVSIQNDGLYADTFKVTGTGSARGFTVTYFNGPTNVTTQVKAGTFSTGSLAPGAALVLKVVLKVAASSASTASFLVKGTSPGPPSDAVKVTVHAH